MNRVDRVIGSQGERLVGSGNDPEFCPWPPADRLVKPDLLDERCVLHEAQKGRLRLDQFATDLLLGEAIEGLFEFTTVVVYEQADLVVDRQTVRVGTVGVALVHLTMATGSSGRRKRSIGLERNQASQKPNRITRISCEVGHLRRSATRS